MRSLYHRTVFVLLIFALLSGGAHAQTDPLPSWNERPAKQAILAFVHATTDAASPKLFGNSTGDQQMLEYTHAGQGARLAVLVLHDNAEREYAYGPAQGLPDTKVGTFAQALYDEAKANGWTSISMKTDWKKLFSFE